MQHSPKVSIIIACKHIGPDTGKCIEECLKLAYPNFEIIVLTDFEESHENPEVIIVPTGAVKPSRKRNIGMKKASGDIFAFIDSDAYPQKDWLKNAIRLLIADDNIGGVTGPNITPSEDTFLQKVGGEILGSFVGLGSLSRRYRRTEKEFATADIMSCNFITPKKAVESLKGFDESLLTGEDYKFGLEILSLGKKIIFSPEVCVYHHRRPVFRPHLKQMWNYGRDKGILMREFSGLDKIRYFLPSAYTFWLFAGMVAGCIIGDWFFKLYIIINVIYFAILLAASLQIRDKEMFILVLFGIWFTHISYGIAFLYGIVFKKAI